MNPLRVINNSAAKCARECMRKFYYAYELYREPVSIAGPLRFGRLWHLGQEEWWRTEGDLDAGLRAITTAEADEFQQAAAAALLMGYHERYSCENVEILAVEQEFVTPLVNPETGRPSRTFEVHGRRDAVVRTPEGVFVVEHKTSTEDISPGSPYWRALRLDSQVSTYIAAESQGLKIDGCIYDVVAKPMQKPLQATPPGARKYVKKTGELYANQREHDERPGEYMRRILDAIAENPDRYYQRGTLVRLESEAKEAAYDLWLTARSIREARRLNMYPRNPGACRSWSRLCDYFDVCTGVADINDPLQFTTREDTYANRYQQAG